MRTTPLRAPDEFAAMIDNFQEHLVRESGAQLSKRECILFYMAVTTINQQKLQELIAELKKKRRSKSPYRFSFSEQISSP